MQSRPVFFAVLVAMAAAALGGTAYLAKRISDDVALAEKVPPPAMPASEPAQPKPSPLAAMDKPVPRPPVQPLQRSQTGALSPEWRKKLDAGLAAYRDKRPDDAIALYANAIGIAERSGKRPVLGVVLSNTGSLYWSMRKLDLAEIHLLRAVEITDSLSESEIVAELGSLESMLAERTQRALALVYRDQRRDVEAIRHFGKAIDATRDLKATRAETVAFSNAGNYYEIAVLQCRIGQKDAASKALAEARRWTPQNPSGEHREKAYARLEQTIEDPRACRGDAPRPGR